MTEWTPEEIERDAKVVLLAMSKRADALPAIWDTGHWEISCLTDLAKLTLRNGRQLSTADQEILFDVGAVIFARIRREAAAEAKRLELMTAPKGTA